jgi:hypothetical protein
VAKTQRAVSDEQRRSNRRVGLILASVALVFFLGVVAKMALLAS